MPRPCDTHDQATCVGEHVLHFVFGTEHLYSQQLINTNKLFFFSTTHRSSNYLKKYNCSLCVICLFMCFRVCVFLFFLLSTRASMC